MSKGRRSVNLASTALTVQSGAQGQKRNDLVVARYAKASGTNVESCTLTVIKGTPVSYGTAADPSVTANDMKLWRIPIDGITPGTPVQLFETIPSIDALRDSVSQKLLVVLTASATANGNAMEASLDFGPIPSGYRLLCFAMVRTTGFIGSAYRVEASAILAREEAVDL